ncbi:YfbM family protein [Streptomyces sp. NPDC059680]|uniref:YfbM family protein n=1 Tax=Streptomyces TaxID=1883 RepID=UPI001E46E56F|nr:YfbM family protein [Streptomyces barringtoniae]MCC5474523.1 YfbM family protein [Streptomyces barringtoniae]
MAARAVLFALDGGAAERLLACQDGDELMQLVEEIEERWDLDHLFELDKSWDALHRCFTDGDLAFDNGHFPLSHVILGGVPLHESDDYIVCYVTAEQVREVAAALEPLDGQWLCDRFSTLTFNAYQGTADAEDIAYTQAFLPGLKNFYRTAARNGRAAIFTVDQ